MLSNLAARRAMAETVHHCCTLALRGGLGHGQESAVLEGPASGATHEGRTLALKPYLHFVQPTGLRAFVLSFCSRNGARQDACPWRVAT